MEKINRTLVEIAISGTNVTADVSPFLSRITYADKLEDGSDSIDLTFDDARKLWQSSWYPRKGDTLSVKMGYVGDLLDCGTFEIDEIEFSTPPDTLSVRALAVPITKSLRTQCSKAFEKQTLAQIARYVADKHGLKLMGSTAELNNVEIERKTQENQTDPGFLAALAKEYGFVFSVRGSSLIFMAAAGLEGQPSVITLTPGNLSKCTLKDKTSQTYAAAVVAKRNARTNTVTRITAAGSESPATPDTLVIPGNVDSDSQAQARAQGALREKNKDKLSGSVSLEGTTGIVAGVNVALSGFGQFDGRWHVTETTHSVDPQGGYTTGATIRKIG